jgi:hypothetical protein
MLHIIIVLDTDRGPYVWSDNDCLGEANISAYEAMQETGFKAIVKTIQI